MREQVETEQLHQLRVHQSLMQAVAEVQLILVIGQEAQEEPAAVA